MSGLGACELHFGSDGSYIKFEPSTKTYNICLANGTVIFSIDASGNLLVTGSISKSNGITLVGKSGFPMIVSAPAVQTGKTTAVTNLINFTPPAATGVYRLTAMVNVTAWTTPATFAVKDSYTDDQGVSHQDTFTVSQGSNGATAAAITAVDRWYCIPVIISIDNSATAITLSTSGTFTGSPVYSIAAALERLI